MLQWGTTPTSEPRKVHSALIEAIASTCWKGFTKVRWFSKTKLGYTRCENSRRIQKGFIDLLKCELKKKPPSQRERSISALQGWYIEEPKPGFALQDPFLRKTSTSVKQCFAAWHGPTLGSPESHARCPVTGGGGSPPLLPFLDLTKTKNTNPLIPCKKFSNSSKKETKRWISLKDRDKWSISIHAKPFSQKSASWTIPKSHTGPVAFASFDSQLGRDGAMLTDSWLCNRLKQKETLKSLDQRGRTHLQPLLWSSKMQNLRLVRLVHC